jgi:P22 coat protein - gene protein 5.
MANENTLTGLIPTIYKAADRVLREQIGFIGCVYMDPSGEMVAKDQNITYPVVPTIAATDVAPAAVPTEPSGAALGYGSMTISKVKKAPFVWKGEEQASISPVYDQVKEDQFAQAFRVLVNEVESDLFLAAKRNASRAYGAAGTTPFASAGVLTDVAETRKILVDNGAWTSDMHMVLNSTSGAKIRGVQANLFKVNEAGSAELLRDGSLGSLEGFMMHESGAIVSHTKGTGTSYVVNGSHAVGATTLVAKTGSGTVLYGDVLALEDDTTNKYVVNTGIAAPGSIVLGKPGLRQLQTDGKTITIGENYLGNFAFERNAIHLLTRVPKLPKEGALGEHEIITDPFSGISFLVSIYPAYHEVIVEVSLAWGVKAVKSEAIVILLG